MVLACNPRMWDRGKMITDFGLTWDIQLDQLLQLQTHKLTIKHPEGKARAQQLCLPRLWI